MAAPFASTIVGDSGSYIQTRDLGGSRFPNWAASAFNPQGMVGVTTVSQLATLSVPPSYSTMGGGGVYGGMTPGAAAAANPWSGKDSPLIWVLLFLVIGFYGIHKLYFEKR